MRKNNDLLSMMELCWSFSSNSELLAQLASQPDPRLSLPNCLRWTIPEQKSALDEIGQMFGTLLQGGRPDWDSLPKTLVSRCELVMATIACQLGEMNPNAYQHLADATERLMSAELTGDLNGLPINSADATDDEEEEDWDYEDNRRSHIQRELYHLLAIFKQQSGDACSARQYLAARKNITCSVMDTRPDLVGAGFVQYGEVIEEQNYQTHAGALWHYWAVADDLRYLVPEIDNDRYPQAERHTALTWLLAAWEALDQHGNSAEDDPPRVLPETGDYGRHANLLRQALTERGIEERFVLPRLGLLGHVYCDETHFAARVIHDLMQESNEIRHRRTRRVNHRFGDSTRQLETYDFAMERDQARQILEGVNVIYDEDMTIPFAALDLLRNG